MNKLVKCILTSFLLFNIAPTLATDTLITIVEDNCNVQVSTLNSQVIYQLPKNTQLNYIVKDSAWFKVDYTTENNQIVSGYIHNSFTDKRLDKRLELLVELAHKQLGKPYEHKSGPDSFDCSGLTRWLYKHLKDNNGNVICLSSIPDSQYNQITYHISRQDVLNAINNNSLDKILQPGDIFCLKGYSGTMQSPGHIGLYVGDGFMIHASSSERKVIKERITQNYMSKHLISVARVIDSDGNVCVKEYSQFKENPIAFPNDMEQLYY